MAEITYWLKGSSELNFGDYLSEYLSNHLFLQTPRRPVEIRVIGSVLHDGFVPTEIAPQPPASPSAEGPTPIGGPRERLIAWGCGIREPGGLSPDHRALVEILSVRGPVSAADLALGPEVPQGDPAFLLPALYTPRHSEAWSDKAVCIPHFHDRRTEQELLSQSGCERVLRPNIPPGEQQIERFIDAVASARFVLSASLHGAVVAAAYRRPFAFWDSGVIDLPTKWRDLAASLGISDAFVRDLPSGVAHYRDRVAPHIRLPSLWNSLAVSPLPVRNDALLKVLRYELSPIADSELQRALEARIAAFEKQSSHFAGIAAEGRNEITSALDALADKEGQLAATARELALVRRENVRLALRLRDIQSSVASATHHQQDAVVAGLGPRPPLFDSLWYLRQNPDVRQARVDPLAHYLQFGAAEGRAPHPLFDAAWYLRQNPDVRDAGLDPLAHYMEFGAAEGRDPHPLFDGAFYCESYLRDVPNRPNPLLHYVTSGAAQGLQPNRAFDAKGYAYQHDDGRECGKNALVHYVTVGRRKGLQPHPLFERDWYVARNPDVIASGMDAYEHFVRCGLPQGRLGSPALGKNANLAAPFPSMTPAGAAAVTIIVASRHDYFDTYRCLVSIGRMTGSTIPYVVALADDDPDGGLARLLEEQLNISFSRTSSQEDGATPDRNVAARLADTDYLVFFDNTAVATEDWLAPIVEVASRNDRVGVVDCKQVSSDGKLGAAGWAMSSSGRSRAYGRGDDPDKPAYSYSREVDCVRGGCFLTTRTAFSEVGGFDSGLSTVRYQDLDFALAVRQSGYSVQYQPASVVTDLNTGPERASADDPRWSEDHDKFCRKWQRALEGHHDDTQSAFNWREPASRTGTILVIDTQLEYDRHAGGLTMFQYVNLMAECGLKVMFMPHDRVALQPYTRLLQQSGIEVIYGTNDIAAWLEDAGRFLDCVWMARPAISYDYLTLVKDKTAARLVYFTHDLHFLRERRRFEVDNDPTALASSEELKQIETHTFNAVDCVMTPSSEEARVISELAPATPVRVLPLHYFDGNDSPVPSAAARLDRRREILFVGSDHPPNVDAAIVLVQAVMPIVWQSVPDARVTIAGTMQHPAVRALESSLVRVSGYAPDLQPHYERARMSVSPLRYGAGTKGKILSSLAAGVPVITTAIGNEGIWLRPGVEALIGDTPEELAAHVIRLFNDDGLLDSLAAAGQRVIEARYSKARAREALLDALNLQVCSRCGRPRPASLRIDARGRFVCRRCVEVRRATAIAPAVANSTVECD